MACVFALAAVSVHGSERARGYKEKGNRFFENHQYTQAIEAFTRAIDDDPDYAAAYYNRGLVYFDMELYYKAIVDFDMAIMMNPKDQDAYYARGLSYSNAGKVKLAMADMEKASKMGHAEAKRLLDSGEFFRKIEKIQSKQKKISAILDVGERSETRKSEIIDVNNEFGGNTVQTTYSKGDPFFDGSDGVFRQLDYYDGHDMLKKTKQYHNASFVLANNINITTTWYNKEFRMSKQEFTFTGKLLNYTGVYDYGANGKLQKKTLRDKFGRSVSNKDFP